MTATVAALCMGYGGLEMGLRLAGIDAELAWCAEIDPHASKVIAHRWPGVPNLGDLTKITDPTPVDIMTAGFPCTDISSAGKKEGIHGKRSGVWWSIADLVGDLRPRRVVLENVADIAHRGGPEVVGSLARMGYGVRWGTVRASDVGAPHRRARWFAVASSAANAEGLGLERCRAPRCGRPGSAHGRGPAPWGQYGPAVARWAGVVGRPAPPTTRRQRGAEPRGGRVDDGTARGPRDRRARPVSGADAQDPGQRRGTAAGGRCDSSARMICGGLSGWNPPLNVLPAPVGSNGVLSAPKVDRPPHPFR